MAGMGSTERPEWDQIWMRLARDLASRSTCSRSHVGCVIVSSDNHRVLAVGYNGGARGVFNECLSAEPGRCGHCHAEVNACVKSNYNDPSEKKAYVTLSPCFACAVVLINAGISEVIYEKTYRQTDGLELLTKAGVKTRVVPVDEDREAGTV